MTLVSARRAGLVSRAEDQLCHCVLCECRCGVDRNRGEKGVCGATDEVRVYRHRVEYGEELELIPSHLFYLSGCNLRCAFCIAEEYGTDPQRGQPLTGEFLAETIAWGRQHGARNIQWVGGEPTIHIPGVVKAMGACGDLPPVVWKSNFYGTEESMDLLDGAVDVYVADFKFGNDRCARRIAAAERYLEVVGRNLLIAADRGDLIVRHLLLPGHYDCCYGPIVRWMRENMRQTKFNVLGGYLPCWQAGRYAELGELPGRGSLAEARRLAEENGLNVIR
jgi:putative pyruvate formate lyase activating enzyme